ncbi:cyclic di-GMP phosphodiesterase [Sulfuriferula plumbiphila]|uniref:Cyclic di-GMP phosphodiesterase n=1 Tax=Sulfuriferula plumbiphila TaxID=171865 RepID=A0A512L4Q4_9PROT|nr:HD-GYP domain-containing protein [Sulfuriferula plumbiphila]BBP03171.1 cyclic di-GMP phosphodiesterase [Sulfuriferula plumbiphila]GEP29458.1 cyclic di-GMP phosphodiesterase [Sulfuriferula plumbiphila]
MLKKINIQDVRLGMCIHEICGSWMDHPFWKRSFTLSDETDFNTLVHCGVEEVWIDTSKGLDVEAPAGARCAAAENPRAENTFHLAAECAKEQAPARASLQDELVRARKIHAKAARVVASMFGEARMGNAIKVEQVATLVGEINQSIARNSDALISLARLKNADNYTYLHSVAVCALMIALGRQLGLEGAVLNEAGMAGLLHDVGKMFIPGDVLNKPGRLTDEEFVVVKAHPQKGWELLKNCPGVNDMALDVCLHHHENVAGTGYPDRLSGEALTLYARMGAVCDVYDAITSNRCYKTGWEPGEAIRKMTGWKDGRFDEAVFRAFVKTVGIYPAGTLVKLKSGRLGVVMEQTEKNLLMPVVKVFFSTRSNSHIRPELVDLSKAPDAITNLEDSQQWGFDLNAFTDLNM